MRWQHKDPKKWHKWFAWLPVQLDHGDNDWVWFETIERRRQTAAYYGEVWFYRETQCSITDTE